MNLNIYAIKDKKAESFAQPWTAHHHVTAIRTATQTVNQKDDGNPLYTNSEDFELHQVGVFDTDTGLITPKNELIGNCASMKREK